MLSVLPVETYFMLVRASHFVIASRYALWTIARCQYRLRLYRGARDRKLGGPWTCERARSKELQPQY
jgi:hypothetical protein